MDATVRIIDARPHDLGGFSVGRVLPQRAQRAIGSFIFLDHMGPVVFAPGQGVDVRPHPHIGLATVTYLYEGEIFHRDSLGFAQAIRPGDINWMTAGRGIVHSERSSPEARTRGGPVHGLQLWVALPKALEEIEPSFHHHPSSSLPELELGGARVRILVGEAFGRRSPVEAASAITYLDLTMRAGAEIPLPDRLEERAVYVVQGEVANAGHVAHAGQLMVLGTSSATIRAKSEARLAFLGGAALPEPRHMVWNFVSTSPERIEAAKRDWQAQRFPKVPGDELEFTPFP